MNTQRFLGVTVLPEYVQTEGIDGVLANLARAGVTTVTTSPYVMEPADERTGVREPPDDAGAGGVRLLDRSLWGRRELFVRTAPAFVPEPGLYAGLPYQPPAPSDLTRRQGGMVRDFVREALARGLKVYLQVQAAIPPGYRVQFGGPREEDGPRLPDGRVPPRRLARNGSLASPSIIAYLHALLRDLCRAYPEIDGLRLDWPEYPPYFLDDVFVDFGPHPEAAAERLGFDFARMRDEAGRLYRLLHGGLTDAHLAPWVEPDGGRYGLLRGLADRPGLGEWLRFKAELVEELLAGCRRVLTEAGGAEKELMPNAFPPPFSLASGMDFARAARHSNHISVKLYGMHWALMVRFYGDVLRVANPGLSEDLLVRALVGWFDIADGEGRPRLEDYGYPGPDEPHPAGEQAQARKIVRAQAEAGSVPVYALAHGYGPADDFRHRLRVAWQASGGGVWINRYGYLGEEKLGIVREVCGG
jgi:hypothetical protein